MQTNCIFITSNFVIHPQILIFSVFNIVSSSPYWLQIKFFMTLFFYLFTLRSICGTGNSSQEMSLQCVSTISMVFSDKDKILIKTHKYTLYIDITLLYWSSSQNRKSWLVLVVLKGYFTHITLSLIHIWRCRRRG